MHAWIGVGSLNLSHDARRLSGTSSWSNATMGTIGVALWIVIECLVRKSLASEDEGADPMAREDDATGVSVAPSVLRFFSFLSFFDEPGASSSNASFDLRFLSFLSFFVGSSGVSTPTEGSSSTGCSCFFLCFFSFFSFFEGLSSVVSCSSGTVSTTASVCSLRFFLSFL